MRKLEFETDAFAFGDKALEQWYKGDKDADKKGVLIVVSAGKEGAVSGGAKFIEVRELTGTSLQGTAACMQHNDSVKLSPVQTLA